MEEALRSAWHVKAVIKTDISGYLLPEHSEVPLYSAAPDQFRRLTEQAHPEGVLAIMSLPSLTAPMSVGPSLLMDSLQDPGNLGTIIRVADWFDLRNIWLGPGTVDPFHPKVVRSSMGSIFRMNMQETGGLSTWLTSQINVVWVADLEGESLANVIPGAHDVLVVGNESRGISGLWRRHNNVRRIRIPGGDQTESLNAGVAAGILLWEWQGKRR